MEYLDEKVIELRRQAKAGEACDINTGVSIDGILVEFEETLLFEDKMSILLPKTFVDMPLKVAKIKYPSEQRPQIIQTDLLGSTNFAFNLFDKPIRPNQMESAADGMRDMIKKVNPANIFYEKGCEPLGDTNLCWFEYKGHALDSQIYYIVYITSIGGNLLHGIFNCAIADKDSWRDAALQVIRSICDLTKEVHHA